MKKKENFGNVMASMKAEWAAGENASKRRAQATPIPFLTMARQCGAGGSDIAERVADCLSALHRSELPWRGYDRELVEKVAEDHELSAALLETLTDDRRTWLSDVVGGGPGELALLRRVAATCRALAEAGRCIIVGRGGVFITRDMPGGVHVRLVAPLDFRVARKAKEWEVSEADAESRIRKIDQNRIQFYQRYFTNAESAETFALTINTQAVPEDKQIELLLRLIPGAGI